MTTKLQEQILSCRRQARRAKDRDCLESLRIFESLRDM